MKTFVFEVRETTIRTAQVKANSETEARDFIRRWGIPGNPEKLTDEDGGPITLSDYDSESIKARLIRKPS